MTGDQHLIARGSTVKFGLDPRQIAGEALDTFNSQVTCRFQRIRRQGGKSDRRESYKTLEGRLHRVKPAHVIESGQVVPALLAQVCRLNKHDPGSARKVFGSRSETGLVLVVEAGRDGQRDVVPPVKGALRFDIEGADGFDLVAEELNPHGIGGVGREDVENPAAQTEFAGYLDHFGAHHALFQQPARYILDGDLIADADPPRHPDKHLAPGHGLKQGLNRSNHQPWRLRARQATHDAEPLARDLVGRVLLAGQLLPRGKNLGCDAGKDSDVITKVIDVSNMSQHDHERGGRMQPERRGDQARRRAPGAVDGCGTPVLESRQCFGKPRRSLDLAGQILELGARGNGGRGGRFE